MQFRWKYRRLNATTQQQFRKSIERHELFFCARRQRFTRHLTFLVVVPLRFFCNSYTALHLYRTVAKYIYPAVSQKHPLFYLNSFGASNDEERTKNNQPSYFVSNFFFVHFVDWYRGFTPRIKFLSSLLCVWCEYKSGRSSSYVADIYDNVRPITTTILRCYRRWASTVYSIIYRYCFVCTTYTWIALGIVTVYSDNARN